MRAARLALTCSLALAPAAAGGCRALAALVGKVAPAETVRKQHELQPRPTLVLVERFNVDDAASADDARRLEDLIVARLLGELGKRGLTVVDPRRLDALRADPNFATRDTASVGRALGAAQVVYVAFDGLRVTDLGGERATSATASARVKVVDAAAAQLEWPTDEPTGRPVAFGTGQLPHTTARSAGTQALAGLAENAAGLFHDVRKE